MLISRMLALGVVCLAHRQNGVLKSYAKMPIPEEKLKGLNHEDLEFYARALYFCACEAAGDWSRGQSMLETIGFKKVSREDGHRVFTIMEYRGEES